MKTVLITGASTGLGSSLALLLAERGHRVWATMRDLAKQGPLVDAAAQKRLAITVRQLDVESAASVTQCVEDMIAAEKRIDVLVNNAGAGFIRTTEQATEDEIRWVMDVNFMGVVRGTKAVMPHMRAAGSGHIVNISSVGGLVGQPFNEIYCAAKFAVEGYTEAMASYVEEGFGIRFSVVEPGGISSDFVKNVQAKVAATGGLLQDSYLPLLQRYLSRGRDRAAADREACSRRRTRSRVWWPTASSPPAHRCGCGPHSGQRTSAASRRLPIPLENSSRQRSCRDCSRMLFQPLTP